MAYKVEAIRREADPHPWEFEFGEEMYLLPSQLDMRAMAALEGGRLDDALRLLLGPDQWTRMQQSDFIFDAKALEGVMMAYLEAMGIDLGKPLPSTGSSWPTETQSRPTFSARTA